MNTCQHCSQELNRLEHVGKATVSYSIRLLFPCSDNAQFDEDYVEPSVRDAVLTDDHYECPYCGNIVAYSEEEAFNLLNVQ